MKTLLDDIELDLENLKCIVDALGASDSKKLRQLATRNISQIQSHLNELLSQVQSEPRSTAVSSPKEGSVSNVEPSIHSDVETTLSKKESSSVTIHHNFLKEEELLVGNNEMVSSVTLEQQQTESVKSVGTIVQQEKPLSLNHSTLEFISFLSLNDLFYFTRELANGNRSELIALLSPVTDCTTADEAIIYLTKKVKLDEESEVKTHLQECVNNYFKLR